MREYLRFLYRCFRISFVGNWQYHLWMLTLTVIAILGLNAWCKQFVQGLVITGMTDQVSWGLYIANFTFLEGISAVAVMLAAPIYIYRDRELHDLVIFRLQFAIVGVIMCLLFVTVDLGQPLRSHHLFLRLNFPTSMLAWDVIVLNVYLLLCIIAGSYLIYCAYRKRAPNRWVYIPLVTAAIAWAISIHVIAGFLYVGLGARPFWNTAIIAPRLLTSAFAAGPAFVILTLQVVSWATGYHVSEKELTLLRRVVTVALLMSMFLLGCEVFTEFYTDSAHIASSDYLYFGLHGAHALVPWIWTAFAMNSTALLLLLTPLATRTRVMNVACVLIIIGIWIEKGMGLIIPAFVPSPLGEIVEYSPTLSETLVCFGIWAFGLLVYTILVRITVPVLQGQLTIDTPVSGNRR
jgi:molybdopterin-containing oxidoreductase family membrane subunit